LKEHEYDFGIGINHQIRSSLTSPLYSHTHEG